MLNTSSPWNVVKYVLKWNPYTHPPSNFPFSSHSIPLIHSLVEQTPSRRVFGLGIESVKRRVRDFLILRKKLSKWEEKRKDYKTN